MHKTIYDHAAEITQDVIKARGEAINGENKLIETYLSDEAVTSLYEKIFRVLSEQLIFDKVGVEKNYSLPPSNCYPPRLAFQHPVRRQGFNCHFN